MSERFGDREVLQRVLGLIRERFPEAISASFQTTDQDFVGFVLIEVFLRSGEGLGKEGPADFEALAAEVWPFISAIGWDGVMGEDRFGSVTIEIAS